MTGTETTIIEQIAHRAAHHLVTKYSSRNNPSAGLIFPIYHNSDPKIKFRISEQEARLTFAIELDRIIETNKIYKKYSIETPTICKYSCFARRGNEYLDPVYHDEQNPGGCSGSIDLSLYVDDFKIPSANIEFKCGTSVLHEFEKDLLKLFAEPGDGIWFHVFAGDHKTHDTITNRIVEARDNLLHRYHFQKEILVILISLDPQKSNTQELEIYTI